MPEDLTFFRPFTLNFRTPPAFVYGVGHYLALPDIVAQNPIAIYNSIQRGWTPRDEPPLGQQRDFVDPGGAGNRYAAGAMIVGAIDPARPPAYGHLATSFVEGWRVPAPWPGPTDAPPPVVYGTRTPLPGVIPDFIRLPVNGREGDRVAAADGRNYLRTANGWQVV